MKVKTPISKPKPQKKSLSNAIQKKKNSKPGDSALKNVVKITDTFEELKAGKEPTGISCANISKPIKNSISKSVKHPKKMIIKEIAISSPINYDESNIEVPSKKKKNQVSTKKFKVLSKPKDTEDCTQSKNDNFDPRLDLVKVEEAVKGLFKLVQNATKAKNDIFNECTPIHLTITAVKMGIGPKRVVRIHLPNSLITDTTDICLIVPDLVRGRNVDHEKTYHYFKDLLAQNGITNIKTILPARQIRVEYNEYEARRNLCHSHDIFLIDQKINAFLVKKLGKEFYIKRKFPITVKLSKKYLKAEIESKLHKTSFFLDYKGTTKTLQVGHMKQTPKQVAENIVAVFNDLAHSYPGGLKNVRCLLLKTPSSESIPIYYSMISRNDVKGPYSKSSTFSKEKDTEGELFGKRVKVKANGDVEILSGSEEDISDFGDEEDVVYRKKNKKDDNESENEDDKKIYKPLDSDENDEEQDDPNKSNNSEDESISDGDGDDAEAEYLNEFEQSKKLKSKKKQIKNEVSESNDHKNTVTKKKKKNGKAPSKKNLSKKND